MKLVSVLAMESRLKPCCEFGISHPLDRGRPAVNSTPENKQYTTTESPTCDPVLMINNGNSGSVAEWLACLTQAQKGLCM